jgi:hypothetical protein
MDIEMTNYPRKPRGQQRDKPYREALRIELAAAGEDMKKLREIAKVHIARCEAGDMQAIKELADRLDGRTAFPEQEFEEAQTVLKIVREIVHVNRSLEDLADDEQEPMLIEWTPARDRNGNGSGNGGQAN